MKEGYPFFPEPGKVKSLYAHGQSSFNKYRVVYLRDGGECVYCHQKLNYEIFTLDHLVPVSKGGSSKVENLAVCCAGCNGNKDSLLPLEFICITSGFYEKKQLYLLLEKSRLMKELALINKKLEKYE